MNKTKIVIIGGGFGGVYTARNLYKLFGNNVEITLINKGNYFIFTPLLHEVATGALNPLSITESLREIFRGTRVDFVEDTVTEIDRQNQVVKTNSKTFSYDYLVIASGAETNYFGTPGAKENSLTLKNLDDAILLRNKIIKTVEKAHNEKNKNLLNFAIIGAGATGVELAAELVEYLHLIIESYYKDSIFSKSDIKVSLITSGPDIIPQFPEEMRKIASSELIKKGISIITNTAAAKVEPNVITFSNGEKLNTNVIIWVAGVKPSLSAIKGIEVGQKGRLEVNDFLQSITNPEIFGLGDSAGNQPMLAQIAVQEAKIVAENIYLLESKQTMNKFSTNVKGLLISLGQWSAAGHFGSTGKGKKGFTLSGPIMWWIWRTTYLFNFNSWKKRFSIVIEWTTNLFYPREITSLE